MRWKHGLVAALLFWSGSMALAEFPKKRGSDFEEGKRIWKRSCWQCHGMKAEGDGPAASAITGGVPSLRGGVVVEDERRNQIAVILNGQGSMPAFSAEFERPDARRVLIYLQKLDERGGVEEEEEEEEEEEVEEEEEGNAPADEGTPTP